MADLEAKHVGLGSSENNERNEEVASLTVPEATGASGVEESSPDLLRNTPSNIAKLEDEIEHCKGRRKYLKQTRSPSDGGDVRWYFCKVPLANNGRQAFYFFLG